MDSVESTVLLILRSHGAAVTNDDYLSSEPTAHIAMIVLLTVNNQMDKSILGHGLML